MNTYRSKTLSRFLLTPALALLLTVWPEAGQSQRLDRFCDPEYTDEANPLRKTVVILDGTLIAPQGFEEPPGPNDDAEDWSADLTRALARAGWHTDLINRLEGSLQPSEELVLLVIKADGTVVKPRETNLCWPGYTDAQLEKLYANRGFWTELWEKDPKDALETERLSFFGSGRRSVADTLSEPGTANASGSSPSYVQALSNASNFIRSREGLYIRVIMYGGMLENSEFVNLGGQLSARDLVETARNVVDTLALRLGGASFYMYGVEDAGRATQSRTFWRALLRLSGGQMASFSRRLALEAEQPSQEVRLELELQSKGETRRGDARMLLSRDGRILDSAITIEGQIRSVLQGNFKCSGSESVCEASCRIFAGTEEPIYWARMEDETLELEGAGGEYAGTLGEDSTTVRSGRTFVEARATVRGCP